MATYYVHGGVGSDGAAGNSGAPWATLGKAYQAAAAGDTIKVRTATYYESLNIAKANLVFEADTGHTPTIDGRYSPALFGAAGYTNFNGGQIKANELPAPTAANQNRGNWVIATNQGDIVSLKAAGATVRGFRIRNVCGGGVGITANNAVLEDCWVDFTYAGAVGITGGCDRARVSNCIITRGSVKYFDPTRTSVAGPAGVQTCMNIRRSTNAIVEYCTVCFNFAEGINCGNDSVTPTARYNISHTNLHWNMGMNGSKGAKIYGNIVYWCENLAGAMDKDGPGPIFTAGDENAGGGSSSDQQIYNNLFVGGHTTFILASGSSNRPITLVRGYIGYNTLVGGAPTGRVIEFGVDPSDKHRNTVMENNIILKHPSMTDFVKLESGLNPDSIVFRNNLSNQALPGVMAGTASIVTSQNGHGLVDPFVAITGTFDVKSTSLPTVTTSFDASNYDLASTAQGIGRASNRSNVNGLTLPVVAVDRYEDGRTDYNAGAGRYYDIGSDEYGGTTPPPDDDAVIASFNRTPGSGNAPLTVNFTDTSQALGAAVIDSWLWEFGDGDTSASQNPTHVYSAAGTYQVTLTVEDISEGLEDSFTGGTVTVTAVSGGSLSASFTRTPIGGEAPETITFTDTSTETGDAVIDEWEWDFRDGVTSALQNPTHEYTVAGTYRPRLTVRDTVRGYQSIFTGPETVITSGAPDDAVEASFTQSATAGQAPLTVNFTDTSQELGSATINSWRWDFRDGTIGTTQSPSHVYAAAGVYAPILTVRDTVLGLVDTAIGDLITVTAAPPPGAGGDVVIRQVRTALSTSDGNQTFTQAGLGGLRPKRARFVVTAATADGTAADGELFGIGATAGGSQWAASVAAEHGVANTNAARRWTDEACILLIDGSGNEVMRATFVDWATNGVTVNIDWTGTPAAYLCTVEFGAGTEYEAWVGTAAVGALGSSTAVTAGFAADAVRGAATWGAKDTAETDATISLGMAHRLGGQYTLDRYYTDGAADGYNRMRLFENQLLHHRYNPSGRAGVSVGGWSATGFALTVISENINSTALLLAEKFGSVMSRVALVASRTSAGSESYGLDFDPQFVEHLISQATALGSYNDSATAGTIGVHTVTDDGEFSNEISGENGSATTNEQSLSDNQLIVVGHTGTTLAAGATTLGTLEYAINHATAPGTAQRWPSLAVEEGQATGGGGDYLTAAYTADVVAGVAPLVVQFTDLSDGTNAITSWAWDFGDGYISTEQNPAHTYLSGGAWAVTLTVSDGTLTDSITTADFVVTTEVVKRRIIVGPYLMRVLRSDSTPVTHRDPVDEENAGYMEAGLALNHLPVSADGEEPDAGSDTVGFWYDAASDSWKTKRVDGTTGETGIT